MEITKSNDSFPQLSSQSVICRATTIADCEEMTVGSTLRCQQGWARTGSMWRFAKSVLFGTIAGGFLPLFLTVPLAILHFIEPIGGHRDVLGSMYIAALPLLISFSFVFASSVVVGLPVAVILKHLGAENENNYIIGGAILGALIPFIGLVLIGATDGFGICILGFAAGWVTAQTWWHARPISNGN